MTLYVFTGNEYSASVDPESLQILTYLRLTLQKEEEDEEIEIKYTCKHWESPTGVFPTLVSDGINYTGVDSIIKELKKQGLDLDADCSDEELAEISAYSAFLSDRLKKALLYLHWVEAKNYTEVTRGWLSGATVFPFTLYVLSRQHRLAKQVITTSSSGNTSNSTSTIEQCGIELLGQAEEAISLLAGRLGDQKYFYGSSLSSFDVLVFGYLDLISQYELPGNNQLGTRLKSLVQLTNFLSDIRGKAYPEIKSRHVSISSTMSPSSPLRKDPTFWIFVGVAGMLLIAQGMRVGLTRKLLK